MGILAKNVNGVTEYTIDKPTVIGCSCPSLPGAVRGRMNRFGFGFKYQLTTVENKRSVNAARQYGVWEAYPHLEHSKDRVKAGERGVWAILFNPFNGKTVQLWGKDITEKDGTLRKKVEEVMA